jgi:hypothetical protein
MLGSLAEMHGRTGSAQLRPGRSQRKAEEVDAPLQHYHDGEIRAHAVLSHCAASSLPCTPLWEAIEQACSRAHRFHPILHRASCREAAAVQLDVTSASQLLDRS